MKIRRDVSQHRVGSLAALIGIGILCLGARAATAADLRWIPSTSVGVVGYKLYVGSEPGFYTAAQVDRIVDIGSDFAMSDGFASHPLENLITGPSWIVLTAYDGTGDESPPSNQLFRDLPASCASDSDCYDGTVCNGEEFCDNGFCTVGTALQCNTADPCNVGRCDTVSGCVTDLAPDGTACNDGDVLTEGDRCEAGACYGNIVEALVPADYRSPDPITLSFDLTEIGQDPPGWLDTGAFNSLDEADLFEVMELSSGDRVFGTRSELTNIHSHLLVGSSDRWSGYEVNGRMRVSQPKGGIGITLYSDYAREDAYYRLRRFDSGSFHLATHGGRTDDCVGSTDTGQTPSANTWYNFRFRAFDDGEGTRVQAKVWSAATTEPGTWQADCLDANATRRLGGAPGVWTMGPGEKYWDDLAIVPVQPANDVPPPDTTECQSDADCGDADLCTGVERCIDGTCVEGASLECADPGPCGAAACDATVGCVIVPVADGTVCGTGDFCSAADSCLNGVCIAGEKFSCPDPGVCLIGRCDPSSGCSADPAPEGTICDDGDPSTQGDRCNAGVCYGDLIESSPPVDDSSPEPITLTFDLNEIGQDPPGWFDTGAFNSLSEADLFEVMELSSGNRVFGTRSELTNIHSHLLVQNSGSWSGYELNGRMRVSIPKGGIGVTLYSDYPRSDAYYRLRRFDSGSFHLAPHADSGIANACVGDTDTGVTPSANTWYNFRFRAFDEADGTRVQAKVWPEGSPEPGTWQADCLDASATRRLGGAPGLWAMGFGEKYWDDLAVVSVRPAIEILPAGVAQCLTDADCDDADACTGVERCVDGSCVEGALLECADPGPCLVSACYASTGCVIESAADGTVCGTGDFCTAAASCFDGACTAGPALSCPDPGVCLIGRCDPTRGCESEPAPDGSYCDDGNIDTEQDACRAGVCTGTTMPPPPGGEEPPSERPPIGEFGRLLFDFEDIAPGESPPGWLDTRRKNSLEEGNAFWVFDHADGNHVFGTTSKRTNIHSHYVAQSSIDWFNYEFRGRMLTEQARSGIGVTLYSDYPNSDSYYRLRHSHNEAFHLANHPDAAPCEGVTTTSVLPTPGTWYEFRFQAFDLDMDTRLRAKVWNSDEPEPEQWQIDCVAPEGSAYYSGSPGLWSRGGGGKFWDDLEMIELDASQLP